MRLGEFATEYHALRGASGIVLTPDEVLDCCIRAARHYAAHGNIRSIDLFDEGLLLSAPAEGATTPPDDMSNPAVSPENGRPITDVGRISAQTALTLGEWAVIQALFVLYVERENAMRLEAARANGIEFFGRAVSEIQADIARVEEEMAGRAFSYAIIDV